MGTYWYTHRWWVLTGTLIGDGYLLVQPWVMGTYWYSHRQWLLTGTSMANVVFLCWKDQGFAVRQVQCLPDSLLLLEYNVCHSVVHLKQSTSLWGPSETKYITLWSIWKKVYHSVLHLKQICITLWSIWNTVHHSVVHLKHNAHHSVVHLKQMCIILWSM